MHLPTPQFSRLIAVLAFDLNNPSLDSLFVAWDHISARYLNRLKSRNEWSDEIESIRLLAIHDAVISILGRGTGFIFNERSTGTTLAAALAATAQASHDILVSVFNSPQDVADLGDNLEESLSLISGTAEKAVGSATGSASASAFLKTFGPIDVTRGTIRFRDNRSFPPAFDELLRSA
ncbi:hypothetical protein JIN84_00220 [Luteolibacter yonseiensis]|uniref:Uncharacterized protein n=1 Tax=Luteolibacter yonseiensis TaxID=1144680 RepID=A0A934QZE0_9BACT|nr:hypothetical protein [Luteolibacter yonseiensis]MBK1814031.1 hypothetical protein [Luteolibacter yonseiensis]